MYIDDEFEVVRESSPKSRFSFSESHAAAEQTPVVISGFAKVSILSPNHSRNFKALSLKSLNLPKKTRRRFNSRNCKKKLKRHIAMINLMFKYLKRKGMMRN